MIYISMRSTKFAFLLIRLKINHYWGLECGLNNLFNAFCIAKAIDTQKINVSAITDSIFRYTAL